MVKGAYKNIEEADLLLMQTDCIAHIRLVQQCKQLNAVTMGGKTVQKTLPSLGELKCELMEIRHALRTIDPTTYGHTRRRFRMDYRSRTR